MSVPQFVAELRALHAKAKSGTLSQIERARYETARDQLARLVMVSQQMSHSGQTLRAAFRMAKVFKVEVKSPDAPPIRASTIDVSNGGFAALLPTSLRVKSRVAFTLTLPNAPGGGGTAPITGHALTASVRQQGTLFRVSFHFEPLEREAKNQLELTLIDAVLERFG
jgi:hypothetical protein